MGRRDDDELDHLHRDDLEKINEEEEELEEEEDLDLAVLGGEQNNEVAEAAMAMRVQRSEEELSTDDLEDLLGIEGPSHEFLAAPAAKQQRPQEHSTADEDEDEGAGDDEDTAAQTEQPEEDSTSQVQGGTWSSDLLAAPPPIALTSPTSDWVRGDTDKGD
jgi:hypothetical protein